MNVRDIDLNLLVVFDAVFRAGSVTNAAVELHLTQSAVSNALGRLRGTVDDPLFVRSGRGLTATPRAVEMAPIVRRALDEMQRALTPPRFDPAHAEHTFHLATNDMGALMLLPEIIEELGRCAPRVQLLTRPMGSDVFAQLAAHQLDFVFGPFERPPAGVRSALHTELRYVCLMRASHPLASDEPLTREAFAEARHLLVSSQGDDRGFVDRHLEAHGLTRRVVMTVPHFTLVPNILGRSDLVAVVNHQLAEGTAERFGLVCRRVPLDLGPVRIRLFWHERADDHPANRWLRELLLATRA